MYRLLLLTLFFTGSAYGSSKVTLLEDYVRSYETTETKFYVNTFNGSVFADLSIGRYYSFPEYCPSIPSDYGHFPCIPGGGSFEERKSNRIKIAGLNLNGNNIIYNSIEGDIHCGRIKRKRRSIKILLNGKCRIESTTSNGKVTFSFVVK